MTIESLLQSQIDALDSSASVRSLLSLLHKTKPYSVKSIYDSAGDMPTDSAYSGMLLFAENNNSFYAFNDGNQRWAFADSSLPSVPFIANFGSSFGYANAGYSPANTYVSTMERYSLTSDGNATDVGDLNSILYGAGSSASSTDGYHYGGDTDPALITVTDVIRKYPYSADTSSTNVATLTRQARALTSSTLGSSTHGYRAGGNDPATPPAAAGLNIIEKFIFASDGNGADVGDLQRTKYLFSASNSTTHGYVAAGIDVDPGASPVVVYPLTIDKWAFASDGNATDVGDVTRAAYGSGGNSSSTHGYTGGGYVPSLSSRSSDIEKYSFSSDGNSAQAGDLTVARDVGAGANSPTSGYTAGGSVSPVKVNTIDKFPYADDGNATDVGDLTASTSQLSGNQY